MWKLIIMVRDQAIQSSEIRIYSLEFNKQQAANDAATFLQSFHVLGSLDIQTLVIHDQ